MRVLFNNTKALKGATGILIPYKNAWREFQYADDRIFYFILLVMVAAAVTVIYWGHGKAEIWRMSDCY